MKNLKIVLFGIFVFASFVFILFHQDKVSAKDNIRNDFVKGEILVKFNENTKSSEINNIHKLLGGKVKSEIPGINVQVVDIGEKNIGQAISDYARSGKVKYAELNFIASALTSDTYYSRQWGLNNVGQETCNTAGDVCITGTFDADIDAPEAWTITSGSPTVKIAILDSGVDINHPDLKNKIVANVNFATTSNTFDDWYGHGTHVAGIAAAETDNNLGVAGIGYNSQLMNVKVLGDDGYGAYSWIANGIYWAVQNNANVINMSLGGNRRSSALEEAVNYAWNNGVVLVAAAGNSANPSRTYPAYYDKVIAIAATDNNDVKAYFSSYGSWVDVAAPGENIYSTFPTHTFYLQTEYGRANNYDFGSGTSMSTPYVSGLAALVWATNYGTNAQSVRDRIEQTADAVPGTGSYWQWGRVNACNAVGGNCSIVSSPTPTPSPMLTPTPTETPGPTSSPTSSPTPTTEPNQCSLCFKGVCDGKCNPAKEGPSCGDCQ